MEILKNFKWLFKRAFNFNKFLAKNYFLVQNYSSAQGIFLFAFKRKWKSCEQEEVEKWTERKMFSIQCFPWMLTHTFHSWKIGGKIFLSCSFAEKQIMRWKFTTFLVSYIAFHPIIILSITASAWKKKPRKYKFWEKRARKFYDSSFVFPHEFFVFLLSGVLRELLSSIYFFIFSTHSSWFELKGESFFYKFLLTELFY